jgi:integrase
MGMINQNWAALVEVPRPEKHEMKVWNETQVSQFLIFTPEDHKTFYRMAFSTGMRRGEIIGLKWEDIDWQKSVIKIRRQVYEPEGGGYRFQDPKTARGRRAIHIGPSLMNDLRNQCNQVIPLLRAISGDQWKENDLIFPSSVGTPRNGYGISKEFIQLSAKAGLPRIRFHDIRHTAASIMLAHNEAPVRVASILGQSLGILLETYAHFIPGGEEEAALLMDQITSPISIDLQSFIKDK